LPVLVVLFLHHLPLQIGGGLAFEVGAVWLIITKVDMKIAWSGKIIVNRPNGWLSMPKTIQTVNHTMWN
jgi:hypothetical protein